ncbi:unnamed protein product [Heligmosomoides polygyrus]|uniref:Uncharacterized protein n=1 Tax=Heligmosomoides polygyrus TaxID=6339 RepID=A0A183G349_HELPZ|nr:unnamed protein product [Heligmosomoides polygyrus]
MSTVDVDLAVDHGQVIEPVDGSPEEKDAELGDRWSTVGASSSSRSSLLVLLLPEASRPGASPEVPAVTVRSVQKQWLRPS